MSLCSLGALLRLNIDVSLNRYLEMNSAIENKHVYMYSFKLDSDVRCEQRGEFLSGGESSRHPPGAASAPVTQMGRVSDSTNGNATLLCLYSFILGGKTPLSLLQDFS